MQGERWSQATCDSPLEIADEQNEVKANRRLEEQGEAVYWRALNCAVSECTGTIVIPSTITSQD